MQQTAQSSDRLMLGVSHTTIMLFAAVEIAVLVTLRSVPHNCVGLFLDGSYSRHNSILTQSHLLPHC
jgi:hypothetical protein